MITWSTYAKRGQELGINDAAHKTILATADFHANIRNGSGLGVVISTISYVSNQVFGIPRVPPVFIAFFAIVWSLFNKSAQVHETDAKRIIKNIESVRQREQEAQRKETKAKQKLTAEIIAMTAEDQNIRAIIAKSHDTSYLEEAKNQAKEIDAQHLEQCKQIVDKYGWPTEINSSKEASHAFWVLVQHASDINFQKKCLALLQKAADEKLAEPADAAYLADRILVNQGLPQIYGTQIKDGDSIEFYPIEDEKNVDNLRHQVGLPSLAEYRAFILEQMMLDGIRNG